MSARGAWWLDNSQPTTVLRGLYDAFAAMAPSTSELAGIAFVLLLAVGALGFRGRAAENAERSATRPTGVSEADFVWTLAVFAFLPVLAGLLISKYGVGIHNIRNCLVSLPAAYLLAVRGGVRTPNRRGELVLSGLLLVATVSIPGFYSQSFNKGEWRQATEYVLENQSPETVVLADGYMPSFNVNVYADILGQPNRIRSAVVSTGASGDSVMSATGFGAPNKTGLDAYLRPYDRVVTVSLAEMSPLLNYLGSRAEWKQISNRRRPDTNVTVWERDTAQASSTATDATAPSVRGVMDRRLLGKHSTQVGKVVRFTQRRDSSNHNIAAEISDPEVTVAAATSSAKFCALGIGGELVIDFQEGFRDGEGVDIAIVEVSWGTPRALERARVYASGDGRNWTFLGLATNAGASSSSPDSVTGFDLAQTDLEGARYVKIVDATVPSGSHQNGVDIASVRVLAARTEPD